jgi:hypothetical protein
MAVAVAALAIPDVRGHQAVPASRLETGVVSTRRLGAPQFRFEHASRASSSPRDAARTATAQWSSQLCCEPTVEPKGVR